MNFQLYYLVNLDMADIKRIARFVQCEL